MIFINVLSGKPIIVTFTLRTIHEDELIAAAAITAGLDVVALWAEIFATAPL
jgi:hypothetical protein